MAVLGDVKRSNEIGYTGKQSKYQKYIYAACVDCGKVRWVILSKGQPASKRCVSCSKKGKLNGCWNGGTLANHRYVKVLVSERDFFSPMVDSKGYVFEHRLVVAKHLGRVLHRWEVVHHKNGIKDDNRLENLQLVTDDRHKQITLLENRIKFLEQRVTLLEAENLLLRKTVWV